MFTSFDTLNSILEARDMKSWFRFLFLEGPLRLFDGALSEKPLRLAAFLGETPWGSNLQMLSEQVIDTANLVLEIQDGLRRCLHLHDWVDWAPSPGADLHDPDQCFLITPLLNSGKMNCRSGAHASDLDSGVDVSGSGSLRPALIICPGGGYECVSFQNEGTPVQILAEKVGYAAFMLRYRTAPARFPDPQLDLLASVQYIRSHASECQVDPDRIFVLGFSAAGHLCASAAALSGSLLPEGRPDALVLGYPVITLEKGSTHEGTALALIGRDDAEKRRELSVETMLASDFPPTFAWACRDDESVPWKNTDILEKRLQELQVPHECWYYPTGGHACGLAYHTSAWDWSERMISFLNKH